jgi:hypothetical protein
MQSVDDLILNDPTLRNAVYGSGGFAKLAIDAQAAMYPRKTVKPPVQRVKGFDNNAQKAERRKAARAKAHAKRQRKAPST